MRLITHFLLIFVGALFSGMPAQAAGPQPEPTRGAAAKPRAKPPYPGWMLRRMESLRERDPEAVLLGDSLVAAWPEEEWRALFSTPAINLGAGGDTTANLLWRIQQAFAPGMRLKSALLLVGTNDLPTRRAEAIAESIATIVANVQANAPNVCVTVVGLLPRRDGRRELETKIEDVNRRLAALASPRVRVANAHQALRDACPGSGPCDLYEDAVHLTRAGYERLTSSIAKAQQEHPCS